MNQFCITYLDVDEYGNETIEIYELESACNSVGLFISYHGWAIKFIEKQYRILSVEIVV